MPVRYWGPARMKSVTLGSKPGTIVPNAPLHP